MTESGCILIVDKEEEFLQTTAKQLCSNGYDCTCAPDVKTALQLLEDRSYDLLISDISMPGNSQLELVKQAAQLQDLSIILMTASPTLESALQAIRLPVIAYLVKPFRFSELLAEVRTAFTPSRPPQLTHSNHQTLSLRELNTKHVVERRRLPKYRSPQEPSQESFMQLLSSLVDSLTTLQGITNLLIQGRVGDKEPSFQRILNLEPAQKTNGETQNINFPLNSVPAEVLSALRHLSRREREIVRLLLENHRLRTVAKALYISPHTARNHLHAVFRKFSVHSQEELLERLASYPIIKEWL